MSPWQQRVLALAAVAQAIAAVKQLALRGHVNEDSARDALLNSVLDQSPTDVASIYGGASNLRLGLQVLLAQIGTTKDKDVDVTRYIIATLALARRLERKPEQLQALGQRIQQLARQKNDFHFDQDTIMTGMAGAYSDFISPLSQPIRIHGKPTLLQQKSVQDQIRALLLAAVRSAILWRQVGGKRRQFIFSRRRMVTTSHHLLRTLSSQSESSA